MPADNPTLEAALSYAQRGWRVIYIWPPSASGSGGCQCKHKGNCPSPGKHPVPPKWQDKASANAAQIERWFEERPDWNIGVKFGRESNLIDVECDSDEAERELGKLLGDNPPTVPTFSARRGKHRLFLWQAGLPDKGAIKIFRDGDKWRPYREHADPWNIEVRLGGGDKGAQSVFPPSRHALGPTYQWLPGCTPEELDSVALPVGIVQAVVQAYGTASAPKSSSKRRDFKKTIQQGVHQGGRNEAATSLIGKLLANVIDPNDMTALGPTWELVCLWNERNQPPMSEDELAVCWGSVLGREQQKRVNDVINGVASPFMNQAKVPPPVQPPPAPAQPAAGAAPAAPPGAAPNAVPPAAPCPPPQQPNGPAPPPEDGPQFQLVVINSEPKIFELRSTLWNNVPIRLTAAQLDDWSKLKVQVMDVTGTKPPDRIPMWRDSKQGQKGILSRLFDLKEERHAPADLQGTLVIAEYILHKTQQSPTLELRPEGGYKQADINHKVYRTPDGGVLFSAQDLQAEAKREGHAWTVKDAIRVIEKYGGEVSKPVIGTRQHRVWKLTREQVLRMQTAIDNSVRVQARPQPQAGA